MGVYLSSPITDKISIDNACENYRYGASSMQGWRMTQEDAHNCLPDFDEATGGAFFAVYDGHGGAEVAQYCAMNFPGFVKERQAYKDGNMKQALEDAFLDFDSTLIEESVIKELRSLAGDDDKNAEEEEADGADPVGKSEAELLQQEASMPLDQLLSKYENLQPGNLRDIRKQKAEQILSPAIKPKKSIFGAGEPDEADTSIKSANLLDESSTDTKDSNNSGGDDRQVANSSASVFPAASNIEDKLINGHADNENNLNKEKEIQDSLNQQRSDDAVSSSSTSGSEVTQARRGEPDGQAVSQSGCDSQSSESRRRCSGDQAGEGSSSVPGEADACQSASGSRGSSSSSAGKAPSSSAEAGPCSSSADEPSSSSGGACSSSVDDGPRPSGSSSGGGGGRPAIDGDSDDDDDEEEDEEYQEESEEEEEEEEDGEEEDDDDEGFVNNPCMDMSNEEPGSDSGCTACVTLLVGDQLYVANAGDSRCVLSRGGKAVDLSFDHKPEDTPERSRIEKAGGKVTSDGRVNGGLNLSRAIGDHFYKRNHELTLKEQMITSLPDIVVTTLTEEDEFMVVACDGIWNFMSSQEVIDMVRQKMKDPLKKEKLSIICEELFDYCLAPNTFGDGTGCDNMTCVIVTFDSIVKDNQSVANNKRCAKDMDSNSSSDEKLEEKKAKVEAESTQESLS